MHEHASLEQKTAVDRLLLLVSDVRAGEGHTALLLTANLFLLLTGYLIIKTVREALILSEGGAVVKSYAAAGQALLLLAIMPVYSYVASRFGRIRLVNSVTFFFISNLLAFYLLAREQVPLGVPFFLWVGVFNLFIVAQFWSFANDIYSDDQGKRLFPIIAFGGSLGAVLGPKIAASLFESLGADGLMLVTAALLGICALLSYWANQRSRDASPSRISECPLPRQGAAKLIVGQPYLLLIAVLMVGSNLVNTTGEFLLGQKVTEEAHRMANAEPTSMALVATRSASKQVVTQKRLQDFIARFYGNFFFTVSLITAVVQFLLVSRIIKFCGVPASLLFLPIIAMGSYSLVALAPVLTTIHFAKVLENSTDYSLQNTARQALFLPTTRETKYKAKAAIDTFFVRMGDLLSMGLVFLSVQLSFGTQTLSSVNAFLAVLCLLVVIALGRRYKKLSAVRR
jgi:AAA family ATP:ADP antiporter